MPIAVRPRGAGVIVVAVMLFALAGFTRVGWLLLFDAVLWGIIIISMIMPWLAIGNVSVRRRITGWQGKGLYEGPMAGDPCEFEIRMENRGLLPAVFIGAAYDFDRLGVQAEKQRMFIAWLGRKDAHTATARCSFPRRGMYNFPDIKLETSVPFGLFRRSRYLSNPTEVLVLPKVHPVAGLQLLDNSGATSHYTLKARVGDQVIGSRSYVSGDPWHHIHWRNSARTGQPQVKEFEKTPDSAITIVFDIRSSPTGNDDALEHAVSLAASTGDFVCRSQGVVRLISGGINEETTDARVLLRSLALMKPGDGRALPDLMAMTPPFSAVLVIVEDSDADGIREATRLAAAQRRVSAILLTGFEGNEGSPDAIAELLRSDARVVECKPGEAAKALALLCDPRPGNATEAQAVTAS